MGGWSVMEAGAIRCTPHWVCAHTRVNGIHKGWNSVHISYTMCPPVVVHLPARDAVYVLWPLYACSTPVLVTHALCSRFEIIMQSLSLLKWYEEKYISLILPPQQPTPKSMRGIITKSCKISWRCKCNMMNVIMNLIWWTDECNISLISVVKCKL